MRTEVWIYILWIEFSRSWSVYTPIGIVTYNATFCFACVNYRIRLVVFWSYKMIELLQAKMNNSNGKCRNDLEKTFHTEQALKHR